jgi:predicted component of type VI protein secretion system
MSGEDQTWSQGRVHVTRTIRRFRLLVVDGTTSSMIDLPPTGMLVIGRAAEADLRLADRSVSRQHARLFLDGGQVRIADLKSHNGVRVNGQQLLGETVTLVPGDLVSIGEVHLALYAASDAPATPSQGSQAAVTDLVLGERTVVVADPTMLRL